MPEPSRKIMIACAVWEARMVYIPIRKQNPDNVYLVHYINKNNPPGNIYQEIYNTILNHLDKETDEYPAYGSSRVIEKTCEVWDYTKLVHLLESIINENPNDEFCINISSGTNEFAAAAVYVAAHTNSNVTVFNVKTYANRIRTEEKFKELYYKDGIPIGESLKVGTPIEEPYSRFYDDKLLIDSLKIIYDGPNHQLHFNDLVKNFKELPTDEISIREMDKSRRIATQLKEGNNSNGLSKEELNKKIKDASAEEEKNLDENIPDEVRRSYIQRYLIPLMEKDWIVKCGVESKYYKVTEEGRKVLENANPNPDAKRYGPGTVMIACVSDNTVAVSEPTKTFPGIAKFDRVHLVHGYNHKARNKLQSVYSEIYQKVCTDVGNDLVVSHEVLPYDFNSLLSEIKTIFDEESDSEIYINISAGTVQFASVAMYLASMRCNEKIHIFRVPTLEYQIPDEKRKEFYTDETTGEVIGRSLFVKEGLDDDPMEIVLCKMSSTHEEELAKALFIFQQKYESQEKAKDETVRSELVRMGVSISTNRKYRTQILDYLTMSIRPLIEIEDHTKDLRKNLWKLTDDGKTLMHRYGYFTNKN